MLISSSKESGTMDELAHIPSGYSYVKYLDYRLNPEHPPLVKALSGIPLLFFDLSFPTEHKSWAKDLNGQWDSGTEFLYNSGNDADLIVFWARIAPILLTLITIAVVFFWAKELMGGWWALVPTIFFGLSPTVLAHGHLVTTDVGATLGTIIALFSFSSFLTFPTKKKLILSGICLGIAELLKFSNVLLFPLFAFISLIVFIAEWRRHKINSIQYKPLKRLWFFIRSTAIIFIISIAIIYAVYFIFTINYPIDRQISDTTAILSEFKIEPLKTLNIYLSQSPIFRPIGHYMLGILMVMTRSTGGNTGYLLGEVTNKGWLYYFPTVFATKEALPALILILGGIIAGIKNMLPSILKRREKFSEYIGIHTYEFSIIAFLILYWAYSIKSNLNIGVRHLLPAIPLIYIIETNSIKTAISSAITSDQDKKPSHKFTLYIIALVLCMIISTITAFPYFISYFNPIGGGLWNGYNIATDSNYDWGQDLKRLKLWKNDMEKNGVAIGKIAIDYFGAGNPEYYFGNENIERWDANKGNPMDKGIEWIAISVNTLSQSFAKETKGFKRNIQEPYDWLQELKTENEGGMAKIPTPDFRAGTSIFVYHL